MHLYHSTSKACNLDYQQIPLHILVGDMTRSNLIAQLEAFYSIVIDPSNVFTLFFFCGFRPGRFFFPLFVVPRRYFTLCDPALCIHTLPTLHFGGSLRRRLGILLINILLILPCKPHSLSFSVFPLVAQPTFLRFPTIYRASPFALQKFLTSTVYQTLSFCFSF